MVKIFDLVEEQDRFAQHKMLKRVDLIFLDIVHNHCQSWVRAKPVKHFVALAPPLQQVSETAELDLLESRISHVDFEIFEAVKLLLELQTNHRRKQETL